VVVVLVEAVVVGLEVEAACVEVVGDSVVVVAAVVDVVAAVVVVLIVEDVATEVVAVAAAWSSDSSLLGVSAAPMMRMTSEAPRTTAACPRL
jgi:hypothetical protein